ncbi:hypothetical protein [Kitasatospora sp. NPDC089509]|uniref:hypothetical protein n=1 Tax=Kitasatospora sp. NPDC089509 TaxID=3364079 RepID=UPI00382043A2
MRSSIRAIRARITAGAIAFVALFAVAGPAGHALAEIGWPAPPKSGAVANDIGWPVAVASVNSPDAEIGWPAPPKGVALASEIGWPVAVASLHSPDAEIGWPTPQP